MLGWFLNFDSLPSGIIVFNLAVACSAAPVVMVVLGSIVGVVVTSTAWRGRVEGGWRRRHAICCHSEVFERVICCTTAFIIGCMVHQQLLLIVVLDLLDVIVVVMEMIALLRMVPHLAAPNRAFRASVALQVGQ